MKSLSFKVIAFFLLITNTQLSSQNYYSFPDSNAIWNVIGDNMFSGAEFRDRFGLYGDTIISTTPYSKLYDLFDTNLIHQESEYFAGLRNEGKKVFIKLPDFQETILYDFSLTIGDTVWYEIGSCVGMGFWLQTHWKSVVSIDSVLIENGEYRKRWHLESDSFMYDTWVEGIGSINWFGVLNPLITEILTNGDNYNFVCFKQNDQVIYLDNPYCDECFCQLYTAIDKSVEKEENSFTIFPNPANEKITLRFNDPGLSANRIIIYNSMGMKVSERRINECPGIELALDNYKSGLHTIQIINKEELIVGTIKFIVE